MKNEKWIRDELASLEKLMDMHISWELEQSLSYAIRLLKRILED